MRKGVIDLDWLNGEIEQTKVKIKVFQEGHILQAIQKAILGNLEVVLSKCQPIEEPKVNPYFESSIPYTTGKTGFIINGVSNIGTTITGGFLSKTCTNNWEDKKFCENTGKCELCKIKQ